MRVGCLDKNLPMELTLVSDGIYNLYAPAQIDFKYCESIIGADSPKDCKAIIICDESGKDRYANVIKHFCEKHNLKFIKIDRNDVDVDAYVVYIGGKDE